MEIRFAKASNVHPLESECAAALEHAANIAFPAHAEVVTGHGDAGNQYELRRRLALEFRALAAQERAT